MDKAKKSAAPGDATDKQLEGVAGGGGRYQDEHGHYREGDWQGHHYHNGYRGQWNGTVWVNL